MDGKLRRGRAIAAALAGMSIVAAGGAATSAGHARGAGTVRGAVEPVMTMALDGTMRHDGALLVADDRVYELDGRDHGTIGALGGSDVIVTGDLDGDAIDVAAIRELTAPVTPAAVGPKRAVVLLYRFVDGPKPLTTPGRAKQLVFGRGRESVASMWKHESNGQLTLTGEVVSETMPADWPYAWSDCTDAARLAMTNHLVAQHPGYDYYLFNGPVYGCNNIAGQATMPGSLSWYYVKLDASVLWHELGHNLGLHHAGLLYCEQRTEWMAPPVFVGPGCTTNEYGDWNNVMGSRGNCAYSAWQRMVAGWTVDKATLTADATVQVRARNLAANGTPQVIVLPGAAPGQYGGSYFLDWRTADYSACKTKRDTGLQIRIAPNPPATATLSRIVDANKHGKTVYDMFLPVGETMRDSVTGTAITLDAVDKRSGVATVTVRFNTPPPPPPPPPPPTSVSVIGGQLQVLAGQHIDVLDVRDEAGAVVVTNTNDVIAGSGCASVTSKRARCTGATTVLVDGGLHDDDITVQTALPAEVRGGGGRDTFRAGPLADGPTRLVGVRYAFYSARTAAVWLSSDGIANDGAPGEGDEIGSTLIVHGGSGPDVFTIVAPITAHGGPGNDTFTGGPNGGGAYGEAGNDTITAGNGNLTLDGGDGDDLLVGGPGHDAFVGGEGNDTLLAKDGISETVYCHGGTDSATVDPDPPGQYVYGDHLWQCENVTF